MNDQKTQIYHIQKDEDVDYVEAKGTLDNLAFEIQKETYNAYDIVVLLTQLKVALRIGTRLVKETDGYAFVGGSCSNKKVAVIEHAGLGLVGASTFAHETAHLLGCPHDGEGPPPNIEGAPGAMTCPKSQGYLMGDLYEHKEDKRKYGLSPCSVKSIEHFLGLPRSQCLIKKNHQTYITSSELPGSLITLNQTCEYYLQQLHLDNGFYDTTESDLKQCDLRCRAPLDGDSYLFTNTEALDGTPCDTLKICRHGKCGLKKN
ncbi:salivary metalloprotease, putative [Ixodes scapularis]|uniref:Salivary metalloprotease, putative n=1 Tax=Ixodes scapularis TaxID=6945 RepID=B7QK26_IXOSC|nr:salivary metalloprotease, putative [Ixodes scapularis]|eukprot:XP_002415533.1 salivary metalloprotease, putative [Ixodes scapularis]